MPAILSRVSILCINCLSLTVTTKNTFIQVFRSVPGCQTYMYKCGINYSLRFFIHMMLKTEIIFGYHKYQVCMRFLYGFFFVFRLMMIS